MCENILENTFSHQHSKTIHNFWVIYMMFFPATKSKERHHHKSICMRKPLIKLYSSCLVTVQNSLESYQPLTFDRIIEITQKRKRTYTHSNACRFSLLTGYRSLVIIIDFLSMRLIMRDSSSFFLFKSCLSYLEFV